MAVESKPNGENGASNGSPLRAKRISSLMRQGAALPTVESSLEEFIARANQTLAEGSWELQAQQAREEDEKRREADAQRWKNAETQMHESHAREQALRRQLDGLQGKLAEAEARVAVAISTSASSGQMIAQHDATITDLKTQIEQATHRMRAAEHRSQELHAALSKAQAEATNARTAVGTPPAGQTMLGMGGPDPLAEERIRLAEAKATKAIAAARAAAAGLTVSPADIAAIESGLVAQPQPKKSSPVLPIAIAFVGGLAIMFVVWKFALNSDKAAPAASAAPAPQQQAQQAAQPPAPAPTTPAPAAAPVEPAKAPAKPVVTPIDETPKSEPAQAAAAPAATGPTVTPIEEPAAEPAKTEPEAPKKAEPVRRVATPVVRPAPAPRKATPAAAPASKKTAPAGIADPFADPAPAKKAPEKKAAETKKEGIVDPF